MREEPLERKAEELLVRRVTAAGGLCPKLAPTEAGIPDRLVVWGGRLWLVELKRPSGRLRAVQREWHARAARAGVAVVVLYGEADVARWLRDVGIPEVHIPHGGITRDLRSVLGGATGA